MCRGTCLYTWSPQRVRTQTDIDADMLDIKEIKKILKEGEIIACVGRLRDEAVHFRLIWANETTHTQQWAEVSPLDCTGETIGRAPRGQSYDRNGCTFPPKTNRPSSRVLKPYPLVNTTSCVRRKQTSCYRKPFEFQPTPRSPFSSFAFKSSF